MAHVPAHVAIRFDAPLPSQRFRGPRPVEVGSGSSTNQGPPQRVRITSVKPREGAAHITRVVSIASTDDREQPFGVAASGPRIVETREGPRIVHDLERIEGE